MLFYIIFFFAEKVNVETEASESEDEGSESEMPPPKKRRQSSLTSIGKVICDLMCFLHLPQVTYYVCVLVGFNNKYLDFAICIIKYLWLSLICLCDLKQVCSHLTHKAGKELGVTLTKAVPLNV